MWPPPPRAGPSSSAISIPAKPALGADRDPGGALLHRQVVGGELADRVQDQRLGNRHRDLPGHRPRERLATQPQHAAERDQPRAARQRRAEAGVEQPPGGQRQHHVEEREHLRQPADRVGRDAVVPRRRGVDRREGQPEDLRRRGDQRVGDDDAPAAPRGTHAAHPRLPAPRHAPQPSAMAAMRRDSASS